MISSIQKSEKKQKRKVKIRIHEFMECYFIK